MNSDMNEAQRSAAQEAVPAALLDIHRRLLEDGMAWRDELPVGATRATQSLAEQTTPRQAHGRNGRMVVMTQLPDMPQAPRRDVSWTRRLAASAAIFAVAGLLAALFASLAHGRDDTRLTSGSHDASPTVMIPSSSQARSEVHRQRRDGALGG